MNRFLCAVKKVFTEREMRFGGKGRSAENSVLKRYLPIVLGVFIGAGLGFLFFCKWIPILLTAGAGALVFPIYLDKRGRARARICMENDSCVMLQNLSAALRSGKSFENALISVSQENPGTEDSVLRCAWEKMCGRIRASIPPEEAFSEMAEECDLQELRQLSAVIGITRQNGGNLSETIGETVFFLREKQRVRSEMAILLARKQNEQRIMNVIPFALLLVMRLIAGSYLSPLYDTPEGTLIMGGCLILILFGWFLSERISGGALS